MKKIILSLTLLVLFQNANAGFFIPFLLWEAATAGVESALEEPELTECDALVLSVRTEFADISGDSVTYQDFSPEQIRQLVAVMEVVKTETLPIITEKCSTDSIKEIESLATLSLEIQCVGAINATEKISDDLASDYHLEELHNQKSAMDNVINYCQSEKSKLLTDHMPTYTKQRDGILSELGTICDSKNNTYTEEFDDAKSFISWFDDDEKIESIYKNIKFDVKYCANSLMVATYKEVQDRI